MNLKNFFTCSGNDCFLNNYFADNFKKGIVNHVSYKNLSLEQRPEVIDVFTSLILTNNPSTIIEIGTFAGGLTLILRDILDILKLEHCQIYTYDVSNPMWLLDQIKNNNIKNINVNVTNLFDQSYLKLLDETKDAEIKSLIQSSGRTILLCDGGCKKCEFNILSQYLKPDDIIMAHDYAPNSDYFEQNMRNKIWNWHEIQDSDIIEIGRAHV